jgi:ABC-type dipeptide/oligopeptide/nickel transport system permease subunit
MTIANTQTHLLDARFTIRVVGLVGLSAIAVGTALNDVLARAPTGAEVAAPLLAPSPRFPFGTDILGRDVASETLHALAVTMSHAALAALVTILIGGLMGFVAAHLPRGIGVVSRWLAGILAAVPALLLAILFVGIAGRAFSPFAAGLAAAPLAFARTYDRARVQSSSRYAEFARATGIPARSLLRRDVIYEFRDNFLNTAARALAAVTIVLATVSFFGFGAEPPHRDLGVMLAGARESYFQAWWTALFPTLALMILILFARLAAGLDEGERP